MLAFNDNTYMVAYAKVIDDKDNGVYMQGIYFGGIAGTPAEAEAVARACVNSVKGGTVIPRIIPMDNNNQILDAVDRAVKRFNTMEVQMVQAEEIIMRTTQRGKRR